jgi:hypothetical protein
MTLQVAIETLFGPPKQSRKAMPHGNDPAGLGLSFDDLVRGEWVRVSGGPGKHADRFLGAGNGQLLEVEKRSPSVVTKGPTARTEPPSSPQPDSPSKANAPTPSQPSETTLGQVSAGRAERRSPFDPTRARLSDPSATKRPLARGNPRTGNHRDAEKPVEAAAYKSASFRSMTSVTASPLMGSRVGKSPHSVDHRPLVSQNWAARQGRSDEKSPEYSPHLDWPAKMAEAPAGVVRGMTKSAIGNESWPARLPALDLLSYRLSGDRVGSTGDFRSAVPPRVWSAQSSRRVPMAITGSEFAPSGRSTFRDEDPGFGRQLVRRKSLNAPLDSKPHSGATLPDPLRQFQPKATSRARSLQPVAARSDIHGRRASPPARSTDRIDGQGAPARSVNAGMSGLGDDRWIGRDGPLLPGVPKPAATTSIRAVQESSSKTNRASSIGGASGASFESPRSNAHAPHQDGSRSVGRGGQPGQPQCEVAVLPNDMGARQGLAAVSPPVESASPTGTRAGRQHARPPDIVDGNRGWRPRVGAPGDIVSGGGAVDITGAAISTAENKAEWLDVRRPVIDSASSAEPILKSTPVQGKAPAERLSKPLPSRPVESPSELDLVSSVVPPADMLREKRNIGEFEFGASERHESRRSTAFNTKTNALTKSVHVGLENAAEPNPIDSRSMGGWKPRSDDPAPAHSIRRHSGVVHEEDHSLRSARLASGDRSLRVGVADQLGTAESLVESGLSQTLRAAHRAVREHDGRVYVREFDSGVARPREPSDGVPAAADGQSARRMALRVGPFEQGILEEPMVSPTNASSPSVVSTADTSSVPSQVHSGESLAGTISSHLTRKDHLVRPLDSHEIRKGSATEPGTAPSRASSGEYTERFDGTLKGSKETNGLVSPAQSPGSEEALLTGLDRHGEAQRNRADLVSAGDLSLDRKLASPAKSQAELSRHRHDVEAVVGTANPAAVRQVVSSQVQPAPRQNVGLRPVSGGLAGAGDAPVPAMLGTRGEVNGVSGDERGPLPDAVVERVDGPPAHRPQPGKWAAEPVERTADSVLPAAASSAEMHHSIKWLDAIQKSKSDVLSGFDSAAAHEGEPLRVPRLSISSQPGVASLEGSRVPTVESHGGTSRADGAERLPTPTSEEESETVIKRGGVDGHSAPRPQPAEGVVAARPVPNLDPANSSVSVISTGLSFAPARVGQASVVDPRPAGKHREMEGFADSQAESRGVFVEDVPAARPGQSTALTPSPEVLMASTRNGLSVSGRDVENGLAVPRRNGGNQEAIPLDSPRVNGADEFRGAAGGESQDDGAMVRPLDGVGGRPKPIDDYGASFREATQASVLGVHAVADLEVPFEPALERAPTLSRQSPHGAASRGGPLTEPLATPQRPDDLGAVRRVPSAASALESQRPHTTGRHRQPIEVVHTPERDLPGVVHPSASILSQPEPGFVALSGGRSFEGREGVDRDFTVAPVVGEKAGLDAFTPAPMTSQSPARANASVSVASATTQDSSRPVADMGAMDPLRPVAFADDGSPSDFVSPQVEETSTSNGLISAVGPVVRTRDTPRTTNAERRIVPNAPPGQAASDIDPSPGSTGTPVSSLAASPSVFDGPPQTDGPDRDSLELLVETSSREWSKTGASSTEPAVARVDTTKAREPRYRRDDVETSRASSPLPDSIGAESRPFSFERIASIPERASVAAPGAVIERATEKTEGLEIGRASKIPGHGHTEGAPAPSRTEARPVVTGSSAPQPAVDAEPMVSSSSPAPDVSALGGDRPASVLPQTAAASPQPVNTPPAPSRTEARPAVTGFSAAQPAVDAEPMVSASSPAPDVSALRADRPASVLPQTAAASPQPVNTPPAPSRTEARPAVTGSSAPQPAVDAKPTEKLQVAATFGHADSGVSAGLPPSEVRASVPARPRVAAAEAEMTSTEAERAAEFVTTGSAAPDIATGPAPGFAPSLVSSSRLRPAPLVDSTSVVEGLMTAPSLNDVSDSVEVEDAEVDRTPDLVSPAAPRFDSRSTEALVSESGRLQRLERLESGEELSAFHRATAELDGSDSKKLSVPQNEIGDNPADSVEEEGDAATQVESVESAPDAREEAEGLGFLPGVSSEMDKLAAPIAPLSMLFEADDSVLAEVAVETTVLVDAEPAAAITAEPVSVPSTALSSTPAVAMIAEAPLGPVDVSSLQRSASEIAGMSFGESRARRHESSTPAVARAERDVPPPVAPPDRSAVGLELPIAPVGVAVSDQREAHQGSMNESERRVSARGRQSRKLSIPRASMFLKTPDDPVTDQPKRAPTIQESVDYRSSDRMSDRSSVGDGPGAGKHAASPNRGIVAKTAHGRDIDFLATQLRRELASVQVQDAPAVSTLGAQLGIRSAARVKSSLSERLADEVSVERLDNEKVLDVRKRGPAALGDRGDAESSDERKELYVQERRSVEADDLNTARSARESSQASSESSQSVRGNIHSYLGADIGRTKVPSGQTVPDPIFDGEGAQLEKQVKDVLVSMRLRRGGGDATFRYETKAGSTVLVRLRVQDDQVKLILTGDSGMLESDLQGALSRLAESVERGGLKVSEQRVEYDQADTGGRREWDKGSHSREKVPEGREKDDDAQARESVNTDDSPTEHVGATVPGRSIHIVV